eukprot:648935-Rhodomonas_salina.1
MRNRERHPQKQRQTLGETERDTCLWPPPNFPSAAPTALHTHTHTAELKAIVIQSVPETRSLAFDFAARSSIGRRYRPTPRAVLRCCTREGQGAMRCVVAGYG